MAPFDGAAGGLVQGCGAAGERALLEADHGQDAVLSASAGVGTNSIFIRISGVPLGK